MKKTAIALATGVMMIATHAHAVPAKHDTKTVAKHEHAKEVKKTPAKPAPKSTVKK